MMEQHASKFMQSQSAVSGFLSTASPKFTTSMKRSRISAKRNSNDGAGGCNKKKVEEKALEGLGI